MLQQCWTTSICLGEIQMSLLSPIVGSFVLLRIFFQNNITTCTIRDSACTYAFFSFTYSFVKILVQGEDETVDYKTLGKNVKKYRLLREMRQEDLAAICDCSVSHIGHIEGGHGKASLEMVVHIANKLDVTVDQLLCDYYDDPTAVYLREIAKRIDSYEVSQRILVCESLENYLNTLERFAKK